MTRESKVLLPYRMRFDGIQPKIVHGTERVNAYDDILERILCTEYEYKNLPFEEMSTHFIERACNTGVCCVTQIPENVGSVNGGLWGAFPLSFVGTLKFDGTSDDFIIFDGQTDITRQQLEASGKKYVIMKNNPFMSSEYYIIHWYSEMMAETDISEKSLIKWCKVHPIAKATTGMDVAVMETVLRDMVENRKEYHVVSDNSKLLTGTPSSVADTVINLTNPNDVQNMHFLSEFHYDILRRFCSIYNIPFHSNSKSAQSLESELHNMDIFSTILPRERFESRKKAVEKMNEVFGWNVQFDYSEWVKAENEVIEKASEENPNNPKENTDDGEREENRED